MKYQISVFKIDRDREREKDRMRDIGNARHKEEKSMRMR